MAELTYTCDVPPQAIIMEVDEYATIYEVVDNTIIPMLRAMGYSDVAIDKVFTEGEDDVSEK